MKAESERNIFICAAIKTRNRLSIEDFLCRVHEIKVVIRGEDCGFLLLSEIIEFSVLVQFFSRRARNKTMQSFFGVHKFSLVIHPAKSS